MYVAMKSAISSSMQPPLTQWRLYISTAGWEHLGTDIALLSLLIEGGSCQERQAKNNRDYLPCTTLGSFMKSVTLREVTTIHIPTGRQWLKSGSRGEGVHKNRALKLPQRKLVYLKWIVGKFRPKGTHETLEILEVKNSQESANFMKTAGSYTVNLPVSQKEPGKEIAKKS